MTEPSRTFVATLLEALVATVDRRLWGRYCRLAATAEGGGDRAPVYAQGSLEWQRQSERRGADTEQPLAAEAEASGRRRLARYGGAPPFAGALSPLGAAGGAAFDDFIARKRGAPAVLVEIEAIEKELIESFEADGRSRRFRAAGFRDGGESEIAPEWFGRVRLDFADNRIVFPDGSSLAGVKVTLGASAAPGRATGERRARTMLRRALEILWEQGAFTAGTGNERVLALVLRELGFSASNPPYGFKSAETVRKLRKALKMSL